MLQRMERITRFHADRMDARGAATSIYNGKTLAVFGLFPGEEAIVEVRKGKRGYDGIIREFLSTRPERRQPFEMHYLSCGPWQTIDYALQAELKKEMLEELFADLRGGVSLEFRTAHAMSGYRTKMEFSFSDRGTPLELAFHERGRKFDRLLAPDGCVLAGEATNAAARAVTALLRDKGVLPDDLKSLVVRESKADGQTIAVIYTKAEELPEIAIDGISGLVGLRAYHSTRKSPASVSTRELWSHGKLELSDVVRGLRVFYAHDAFFQNNIPMFELALGDIAAAVRGSRVVELYAGVGVIGLALAGSVERIVGVEIIPSAVENARANAKANGITNYEAILASAEKALDAITGAETLVLDPPRAGLHPKLVAAIGSERPRRIVYLSCNPETQARDAKLLLAAGYELTALTGYDFYPETPHCESLAIFDCA